MTQRDKKTLTVLVLSLVGVGIGYYALNAAYLGPVSAYNRKIGELNDKIDLTQDKILQVIKGRELLKKARDLSLPVNPTTASSDYYGYLRTLLDRNGLTEVNVKPDEIRATPTQNVAANAAKKPAHTVFTVTISAKGTLAAVAKSMDELQRTPLQQRIKSFTLGYQESGTKGVLKDSLNLTMTMEAMIVAGTDPKKEPVLTVNKSKPLPSEDHPRTYTDLAKRNIFLGPVAVATRGTTTIFEEKPIDATKDYVKDYIRLVQTDATNGEAYLRQLLFKDRDQRVRSGKNAEGFDSFKVVSESGETIVKAYILRIDQRDMYIMVDDIVYAVHIGRTVSEGMRHPLSNDVLRDLDLMELVTEYDRKMDKEKAAAAAAPQKGGKNTKGAKKGQ